MSKQYNYLPSCVLRGLGLTVQSQKSSKIEKVCLPTSFSLKTQKAVHLLNPRLRGCHSGYAT